MAVVIERVGSSRVGSNEGTHWDGIRVKLYWGYAGVMEKKMETPKFGLYCHQP